MQNPIIIDDGYNTNYISALLVALFYKNSYFDCVLANDPKNYKIMYLQELIKYKFVDKLRSNMSILTETINEIRLCLAWCDIIKYDTLLNNIDVYEMYVSVAEKTHVTPIEKTTCNIYMIELAPEHNTSIKDMLDIWKRINTVINTPLVICINIQRTNNCEVNIQKSIRLCTEKYGANWKMHSIICKEEQTNVYYSVLENKERYYLFSDKIAPAITLIEIKDPEVSMKIKSECVMILYTYVDIGS